MVRKEYHSRLTFIRLMSDTLFYDKLWNANHML